MKKLKENKYFTDEFISDTRNLLNLSRDGSQENSIFDTDLTAIEFRLFAEIRKNLNCISIN